MKKYLSDAAMLGEDLVAEEPGLMISEEKPFLGASLDRVILDKNTGQKWGLEVKCPISKLGMTVEEATKTKSFYIKHEKESNKFSLKRSHDYYFQIQGQLFVSKLPFIEFVIYFGENHPIYIERITFDSVVWYRDTLPRLEYFYKMALFPEILTRRVQRKKALYIHGGWIPYTNVGV